MSAWTFDELYGRDGKFLDGLQQRGQAFVAEVPANFHGWVRKPQILRSGREKSEKRGRHKHYPRVARRRPSCEVREAKDELGMDHYQVRGWRCLRRHFFVTQLSHLFCARMRQQHDDPASEQPGRLTLEQVRSAMNTWLSSVDLKPASRQDRYKQELEKQRYYQRRSQQVPHENENHPTTRVGD